MVLGSESLVSAVVAHETGDGRLRLSGPCWVTFDLAYIQAGELFWFCPAGSYNWFRAQMLGPDGSTKTDEKNKPTAFLCLLLQNEGRR